LSCRCAWRAETVAGLTPSQLKFVEKDDKKMLKITVLKSKTNQTEAPEFFFVEEVEDKRLCLVSLMEIYLDEIFGKEWSSSTSPLFANNKGGKLSTGSISAIIKRMAKKAGNKENFSSRSLRVGALHWMSLKNVPWEQMMSLGWKEGSVAAKRYLRNISQAMNGTTTKMWH